MKFTYCFLLIFATLFISCDNNSTSTNNAPIERPKENPKFGNKIPAQPGQKNPMVESEVLIPEAAVNDGKVNYEVFAKQICECAKRSNELNSEMESYANAGNSAEFTRMTPIVNASYLQTVDCAKEVAFGLQSEYSMNSLLKNMKSTCGTYHDKLIFDIVLGLKKG